MITPGSPFSRKALLAGFLLGSSGFLPGCDDPVVASGDTLILPGAPPADAPRNEIVFLSNREGGPLGQGRHELWAVRADMSGERQITDDDVVNNVSFFALAPDSASLIFEGTTGRRSPTPALDVWVIDPRGGDPTNLTRSLDHWAADAHKPAFTDPHWAPDLSKIAISYHFETWFLQLLAADGTFLETLGGNDGAFRDWKPRWSPDGRTLAFLSNRLQPQVASLWQLFVMDLSTGAIRHVSRQIPWAGEAIWSPDGRTIAFWGGPDVETNSLYVSSISDLVPRKIVAGGNAKFLDAIVPSWSPDGRSLTFAGVERYGVREIYVVAGDGSNLRRVTFLGASDSRDPVFSPDGSHIAFSSDLRSPGGIYVVRLSDLRVWEVTTERYESRPAWLPLR